MDFVVQDKRKPPKSCQKEIVKDYYEKLCGSGSGEARKAWESRCLFLGLKQSRKMASALIGYSM